MGSHHISAQEAMVIIEEESALLVDIRDKGSFSEGRIKGAVHVDQGNLKEFLNLADKNKPMICYCYHGISSQDAARFFSNQGFKQVVSLDGGFEAWLQIYPYHIEPQ